MKKIFLMFGLFILQAACSPTAKLSEARWDGHGDLPEAPKGVRANEGLIIGDQRIQFETQKVEGVPVDGSFFKKIADDGHPVYQNFRWLESVPLAVRRDLILMRTQRSFVLSKFRKTHVKLASLKLVEGPELRLRLEESPQPTWRMIFENAEGRWTAYYLNKNLELISEEPVGSHLIDATAMIYPQGPLKSKVQQVLLRDLVDANSISTSAVTVTSESGQVALPGPNFELNFQTDDSRFSQVQALYFVTETLQWFEKNLAFKLPFVLEVETDKGFPEKTNTAFYFQRKIRLGEGDGVIFDRIPLDPSIVTHEAVHALIEAVAGLPYQGEGGSLNEAFADFFTATMLNNPKLGEVAYKSFPFKRTVENSAILAEKNGGLYHDSAIVSGLLWSLSHSVGPENGRRIAWQTLLRLNPFSDFASFRQELDGVISKESSEIQTKAREVLEAKGW